MRRRRHGRGRGGGEGLKILRGTLLFCRKVVPRTPPQEREYMVRLPFVASSDWPVLHICCVSFGFFPYAPR